MSAKTDSILAFADCATHLTKLAETMSAREIEAELLRESARMLDNDGRTDWHAFHYLDLALDTVPWRSGEQ